MLAKVHDLADFRALTATGRVESNFAMTNQYACRGSEKTARFHALDRKVRKR